MKIPKFNITDMIEKRAINVCNEKKTFKEEWKVIIITTLLLKIVTILVSTFCGYFDIYLYLYPVIKNEILSIAIGIISILILEFFTALFLSKVVKFLLHWEKIQFSIALVGAIFLFYISFNVSTEGLAKRQGIEFDNSKIIITKFDIEKNNAKIETEKSISEIRKLISTIERNPQGWQNHKREILLSEQLSTIENYNQKILELRNKLNNTIESINKKQDLALSTNDKNINKVENKYYFFVVIIICINFICNFLIIFFYTKIKDESNKNEKISNEIKNATAEVDQKIQNMLINRINLHLSNFNTGVDISTKNEKKQVKTVDKNETNAEKIDTNTNAELNEDKKPTLTYAKEVEIDNYSTRLVENDIIDGIYKICEYCGKKYKFIKKDQRFCTNKKTNCKNKWWYEHNKNKS